KSALFFNKMSLTTFGSFLIGRDDWRAGLWPMCLVRTPSSDASDCRFRLPQSLTRKRNIPMPSHRLRPGEIAVELPRAFDAGIYFIGRIHTPWARREDCPKNSGESKAVCTIEVDARYAEGLRDIETVSHLIVLYFMDEAARDIVLQAPSHYRRPHGAFAL